MKTSLSCESHSFPALLPLGQPGDLNSQRANVLLVPHYQLVHLNGGAGILVVGFAVVIGIRAANAALGRAGEITGRVLNDLRLIFAFQQRALPEAARRGLEGEIADAIRRFGGTLNIYDTMDLYLARKP